jgi:hypothetical protein
MPKISYVDRKFSPRSLGIIEHANEIIEEYQSDGLELTLRQLYYQFVSRALIPNSDREYKNLGSIINDARLAGHIDWNAIVDRTRNLKSNSHWENASEILDSAASSFAINKWENQPEICEVWIEKDALVGVIEDPCRKWDVSFFSCRGYTSQSEMWTAAQRLANYIEHGQEVTIFHLGDHDPSGIDMSRDIQERLDLLSTNAGIRVERIALTMDQIKKYNPPPNPAKLTDARCAEYIKKYGKSSWELDALEPRLMQRLIESHIRSIIDDNRWNQIKEREDKEIKFLKDTSEKYKKSLK